MKKQTAPGTCAYDGTRRMLDDGRCAACGRTRSEAILYVVDAGLGEQFADCSFSDMIEELELTEAQKVWARENISYRAYISSES